MPNASTFEFVVVSQQGQTTKKRQLQQAFARSHAARVSHSSKKRQRQAPKKVHSEVAPHGHQPKATAREAGQSLIPLPQPRSIIGRTRSDPFNPDALRQIPVIGLKSLEYAYTVLWPKNYPTVTGSVLNSMQTTWRRRAVEDPLQFHAQLFNAATMCYALSLEPSNMKELTHIRLNHQTLAVSLVRKRLEQLEGPAPEQLIADIMRLAVQGGNTFRLSTTTPYPVTPLANAFAVKPYGRFETSLPHFSALVHLVRLRGGLSSLGVSVGHPLQLYVKKVFSESRAAGPALTIREE